MKLDTSQNWDLFGYDVRHLSGYWTAAWRDMLWSHDSPVRRRLDEAVTVHSRAGVGSYQAGSACAAAVDSDCKAVLLPEELVLCKQISVPLQAEGDMAAVLALEVRSSSPFAAADTRWGWTVAARDESTIRVALAIVSASATMTFLGRDYDSHDAHAQEVWAEVDGNMVVVQGFGEDLRERRYRRRLLQSGALIATIAVLLLAMVAVSAMFKRAELQRLEQVAATTATAAAEASRLKSLLAVANETIAAANQVVAAYPNPHAEIARLTRLFGDEASISSFSMAGPEIRLRGRASDAARVLEELTAEPGYLRVVQPQVTTRVNEYEQFYLNITVGNEVAR